MGVHLGNEDILSRIQCHQVLVQYVRSRMRYSVRRSAKPAVDAPSADSCKWLP